MINSRIRLNASGRFFALFTLCFGALIFGTTARGATFTVTTTNGGAVANDGFCSLREAINSANGLLPANTDCGPAVALPGGGHTINFNITDPSFGSPPFIITPNPVLPAITQRTTIDGMSQSGSGTCPGALTPQIVLDFGSYPTSTPGLLVTTPNGSGTVVRGLVVRNYTTNSPGIAFRNVSNNVVECNFIGTNPTGTASGGPNQQFGLNISTGSDNIVQDNLVSGNSLNAITLGISLPGDTLSRNVVRRNTVGTNLAGTAALANGEGISLNAFNGIGDGNLILSNLVSGNVATGIEVLGTSNTRIQSNKVGTNATGMAAIPNLHGINIAGNATGLVIGTDGDGFNDGDGVSVSGPGVGERNLVSGNTGEGITLGTGGVRVSGNWLGVDATGNAPLGNVFGVAMNGDGTSGDNIIGTNGDGQADAAERNVIGGSGIGNPLQGAGVAVSGLRNRVSGNYIGVGANGTSVVSNEVGVRIVCTSTPTAADGNIIGTNGDGLADVAERNIISGNTADLGVGVMLDGGIAPCTFQRVAGNWIGLNAAGNAAIGNTTGVLFQFAGSNNIIGTRSSGVVEERNIISGNAGVAVRLNEGGGFDLSGNHIAGNWMGLDATGGSVIPNGTHGVEIIDTADAGGGPDAANVVGSAVVSALEANIIVGQPQSGVQLQQGGTQAQVVGYNYLGTNSTFSLYSPNLRSVRMFGNSAAQIIGNRIYRNGTGVELNSNATFSANSKDNCIAGNTFGAVELTSPSIPSPVFTNNWWGPGGPNPPGTGDTVTKDGPSPGITATPALGTAPNDCPNAALAPAIGKSFLDASIAVNATTTLTVTIGNPTASGITGVSFTDNLPSGLRLAGAPSQVGSSCGSPVFTGAAGDPSFVISGGSVAANGTCTVQVLVRGITPGVQGNQITNFTYTSGPANISSNTATVTVVGGLTLTKSFTNDPTPPGGTVTLQFVVTNTDTHTTNGIGFTDNLDAALPGLTPIGLPLANICGAGSQLSASGNTLILTGGTLTSGANCTFSATLQVPPAATPGAYNNVTSLASGTTFNAPVSGPTATDNLVVGATSADVSMVKTLTTAGPYTVAQTITYTLLVTNNGPSPATSLQVTDTPSNLSITSVTGGGCAALPCTIATLASGSNVTITVTATINAAGAFDNSASVSAAEPDANLSNNTDNTGNGGIAAASADVSMVKTLTTAGPYLAGQSITYTLVVANGGPSPATSIQVTDTPSNLSITSVTGGGCAALPCTIASLASGSNVTITVTATITASGAFDNSATAMAAEGDPNLANNTDSTGNGGTASPAADVSMVKSLTTAGPYFPGESIMYTLLVANNGPSTATTVQVTDTPTNLNITSVSGSGCAALPCTIASLASGANTTINVTATIIVSGAFDNTATATASQTDPNLANNTDNTGNGGTATAMADLSVVKTLTTAGPYLAGQTIIYTILVTNAGPNQATTVQITDTPTNLNITSVAGGGCTSFPCTLPTMNASTNFTITVAAKIIAAGAFDNSTSISATETDPNLANNTDNTGNGGTAAASADVSMTKTLVTAGPYVAGQTITYTLVVANAGPSTATAIQVTDTPNSLTITGVSGACAALPCTIASLASGGNATITVTATINPAGGGFDNTASANAAEADPVPSNNTDSTGNNGTASPSADVSVTKTLNTAGPYAVGETITYTIFVANAGPSQATTVQVTDTPANLTITSVAGGGCGALPCTIGGIIAGANRTITVTATINAAGPFDNSTTVSATQSDPDLSNNTDNTGNGGTATVGADLSMVKTPITPGPYTAGQTIGYTLLVSNAGPATATSVLVTDTPTNLTIATVSGAGCSSLPCTVPTLASGANFTINVTATINANGPFDNSATVSSAVGDPDPSNNTDNTFNGSTAVPMADVSMVKTLTTAGPFAGGQTVNYTLVVANGGPNTATTIQVTDTPTNLTIVNVSGGGCVALPCTIASLASGANVTINVTATITANGAFNNSATATAAETDPNLANNTDSSGNGGTAASADLSVVKTLTTTGPYLAGQTILYTILVGNAGPSQATSVQITDTPTNLTITSVAGGGCTTFPCNLPTMNAGTSFTINVSATINAAGAFDNSTTISAAEVDPNPADNTDNSGNGGTAVAAADVSMTKTLVTAGPYFAGQAITYTLVVANAGPSTATSIQVTDTPNSLTITNVSGACTALPCTIASLAAGANATITVTSTINPAGGGFDNTASANGVEADPVPSNNTDSIGNNGTAAPLADVSVTKTLNTAGPYLVGQTITYTIVVANAGPSQATTVQVTDTPTNLTITSVAGGGCAALPCTIGGMIAGANGTIIVTATINAAGAFDNSTSVSASQADPDLSNNTDNTGNGGNATLGADVSMDKTLTTAGPFLAGQSINYTLTVSNAGPATATSVQVTDTPANLTITNVSGGGCAALPCTIASVAPAGSVTVNVTATISAVGAFDNSATALGAQGDPDPTNNTDNTGNGGFATASADVSMVKTLTTPGPYASGQTILYTLVVANAGPSPATLLTLTDTPTNLTITSVSGGGCAALPCNIASLAAGASVTINVSATINALGAFDNVASVTLQEPDPAPANNIDNTGNGGIATAALVGSNVPALSGLGLMLMALVLGIASIVVIGGRRLG